MEGDPFADTMNTVRKYVVSNTLKSASAWRNSTPISGDVVDAVRKLKQESGKNILMDGSSILAQELAKHDLVDRYSLHVYPIILGGGKRLFPEGKRLNLTLVEAVPLPRASSSRATDGAHRTERVGGTGAAVDFGQNPLDVD